jgi:hypothetical protein
VLDTPSWCLYWKGTQSLYTIASGMKHCRLYNNKSNGTAFIGEGHTTLYFYETYFNGDVLSGQAANVIVEACRGIRFNDCGFEPNANADVVALLLRQSGTAFCQDITLDGGWFEGHYSGNPTKYLIAIGAGVVGAWIKHMHFARAGTGANGAPRVLSLEPGGGSNKPKQISLIGCHVEESRTGGVPTDDLLSDHTDNELSVSDCVVFNTNGAGKRPLEFSGFGPYTTEHNNYRRFRVPRLTTTERDALTAGEGLYCYNVTTGKFQGYASAGGAGWKDFH